MDLKLKNTLKITQLFLKRIKNTSYNHYQTHYLFRIRKTHRSNHEKKTMDLKLKNKLENSNG